MVLSFSNKTTTKEIEDMVRKSGTKSLVFAYDGTRRSHLIQEVIKSVGPDDQKLSINWNDYSQEAFKKMLELSVMMFNHGLKEIIYPMWFPTLGKRGKEYVPKFISYLWGLDCLHSDPILRGRFEQEDIRIIFYGEWRELCRQVDDKELESLLDSLQEESKHRTKHILLFGTTISSPSTIMTNLAIEHFKQFNTIPSRDEMIISYYGYPLSNVDIYIGFDRFVTDGRPPIISEDGNENLYFTVSPHSYFNVQLFRSIIIDHLFNRTVANTKEYELTRLDIKMMHRFYSRNNQCALGVGNIQLKGNFWYPMTQIKMTRDFLSKSDRSIISSSDFNGGKKIKYIMKLIKQLNNNHGGGGGGKTNNQAFQNYQMKRRKSIIHSS